MNRLMSLSELEARRQETEADLRRARASLKAIQAQRTIWEPLDTTRAEQRVRRLEARLRDLDEQIAVRKAF